MPSTRSSRGDHNFCELPDDQATSGTVENRNMEMGTQSDSEFEAGSVPQTLNGTRLPRSTRLSSRLSSRPTSDEVSAPSEPVIPRKRGRPKGTKTVALSLPPKRPVGRPRGSGAKQRERARLQARRDACDSDDEEPPLKRRVGRPRKDAGGTVVEFGSYVIPGSTPSISAQPRPPDEPLPPQAAVKNTSTDAAQPQPLNGVDISQHAAIPREDPQRVIELDIDGNEDGNEDDEDGCDGKGVGEDEGDVEDGDREAIDDLNDPVVELDSDTCKNTLPRRPLPDWLSSAFQEKIKESAVRNGDGLPPLYSSGTFWFPQMCSFFILKQADLSPQKLFNPRFFLWDPECLCDDGIPCPNCQTRLYRHAHISRPRRCVDVNSTFWIIGYRYRCPSCRHPKTSRQGTVTFRSWDSRILAKLPPYLAAQFPARLSHRSGLALSLCSWMRACFNNGMGAKQLSDALRCQHLERYDKQNLQYLYFLSERLLDKWVGKKYLAFPPFDDRSSLGYCGYSPCAQFLRDEYDKDIENHKPDFNQHTAMLSAEVCSSDHSHKVPKQIARVSGEQVFHALHTLANEVGEIRACNLVATKSQSQYSLALSKMRESLNLYGLQQPALFYTDNMSDKSFLESCFPSLLNDVIPVDKYANLDALSIPNNVQVFVCKSATTINEAMSTILDDLPSDDLDTFLVVGFDSEWNIEFTSHGRTITRGQTAIVQIAYKKRIYVLQIADMIAAGTLPHQLKLLLAEPRIQKVGRCVNTDLKYLQLACDSSVGPFIGGLDLAKYAKERHVIPSAQCSLADLCAVILRKRLNKNVSERISEKWEDSTLTEAQVRYAATDAYASLALYETLSSTYTVPHPLVGPPQAETPVLLYSQDNTSVIAQGQISSHLHDKQFDGINVTPTRTVIDVSKVLVPGAIITAHKKLPLLSFGPPPFSIVCLRSHLRVFKSPAFNNQQSNEIQPSSTSVNLATISDLPVHHDPTPLTNSETGITTDTHSDQATLGDLILETSQAERAQSLESDSLSTTGYCPEASDESITQGRSILGTFPDKWDQHIHSRVLKDCFHVFNMFYIPAHHGLRVGFAHALRDAIFIPDADDRKRIENWGLLQDPPQTFDQIRSKRPTWLWRRCKRIIPPPHLLYPLVRQVFETHGPLKDAATGAPLFNRNNWEMAKHILDLIKNGFVSDPPGIPLYTPIGIDRGGLPIYRCARGTNFTEGGVHTHLRSRLPASGVSIRHVHTRLIDFVLRHNLLVGTYNRTGQRYRGHFSIWLTNELQELLANLRGILINPSEITNWVNGNFYVQTSEVLGILPILPDIRSASGMTDYIPSLDNKQKHHYLAEMQGTHKPVLPVHTPAERQLFRSLMDSNPEFSSATTGPIWAQAVKVWNQYSNVNNDVYYKLTEQLKVHYTAWKTNLNVKETLSMTRSIRKPVISSLIDPQRSSAAPKVPEHPMRTRKQGSTGLIQLGTHHNVEEVGSTSPSTSHIESDSINRPEYAQSGSSSHPVLVSNLPATSTRDAQEALARQKVINKIQNARPTERARKRRTCYKCGIVTCSGSLRRQYCRNACRDCGNVECRGRNSRRPGSRCKDAWD